MKHEEITLSDSDIQNERWRHIPGYEFVYEASNMGRIRTCEGKTTESVLHGTRKWKQRILKPRGVNPATGYRASLWKGKKQRDYLVARLVALTWINGYQEGMTVNHINGNRFDNRIINLEWVSLEENIRDGFRTGLFPSKETVITSAAGEIYRFRSMSEASRFLGKNPKYIHGVLSKGKSIACGYKVSVSPETPSSQAVR